MATTNEERYLDTKISEENSTQASDVSPISPPGPELSNCTSRFLIKTDETISHLSRILSTASGTDTLLLTICYTSLLSSTILTSISLARLRNTARILINKVLTLPPETTILLTMKTIPSSRLLKLSMRLKALSSLISDVRIFARLWGLISIWTWAKSVFVENPNEDQTLNQLERLQVIANIGYQYLENYAYLSSKGVLGWSQKKQNRAWIWSSRFWALHVILEFVRLWREKRVREEKGKCKANEKSLWINDWENQVLINTAYAPLTVHWSLEKGLVNEFFVGLLGSIVGLIKIRQVWNKTR
ncbi:putative peroxin 11c [Erysiphe neolycopersici]|uniref:Putative peroxin 11c n=1 Tax=Erysiphe neolycopersici TaxID=212602 RepID=A0A420HWF3_9PEZI|nr:putative peroxin 11c [Erysiphe neolycopersici]